MDKKEVFITQDFSIDKAVAGKYDFLKEHDMESGVVQDAYDISESEFMNRFLTFEMKEPDTLPVNVEMVEKMHDAHIVISHFLPVSTVAIEKIENLETTCILCSGVKNVDLKTASRKGVRVSNAPGRLVVVVLEFTVGMIRAEIKNIARAHANMMKGVWENRCYNSEYATTLGRRSMGLVGHGTIGTRVAGMMASFDANILVYDPYTPEDKIQEDEYGPMSLNELCSRSDMISTRYRLTLETKNMIGGEQPGLVKPHVFLINPARAGLVDEECLIDALKNHRVGGATLGVFREEPLEPNSPYLKMDNMTLTPHIAGTASNPDELAPDVMEHILRCYFRIGEWMHAANQEKDKRINEGGIG